LFAVVRVLAKKARNTGTSCLYALAVVRYNP